MASPQLDPPLTPIIDTVTGSVTEIGRRYLRTLGDLVGALPPVNARYVVTTPNPALTAEVNLGALPSGYLKLATAIGIATPSTVATIPQADVTGLVAALAAVATLPITEANVTGLVADLAAKAPLASPTFSGVPAGPTAAPGTTTTQLATTAFSAAAIAVEAAARVAADALKAPLASPALTGVPTVPTAGVGTNTTQAASTAFVLANAGTPAAVGASAFNNAAQSIASATWTILSLNAEDFDTSSMHDLVTNNARVTCPTTGYYLVIGGTYHANAATGQRDLALQKNSGGTALSGAVLLDIRLADATYGNLIIVSGVFLCVAGDYFDLAAYQDSGTSQTVGNAARRAASVLQVMKIG